MKLKMKVTLVKVINKFVMHLVDLSLASRTPTASVVEFTKKIYDY